MARNADYDDAVNNLIQGGDAMVKRIEAFKANDGSLHETEKDAKLRNLIGAICKGHRAAAELHVSLRAAMELNRDAIIQQIEEDWVLTKPSLTL